MPPTVVTHNLDLYLSCQAAQATSGSLVCACMLLVVGTCLWRTQHADLDVHVVQTLMCKGVADKLAAICAFPLGTIHRMWSH
jgi:hypothetical protein